jgi:hypothetical protein
MTASRAPGLVLIALAAVLLAFAVTGVCGGVTQLTARDDQSRAAESTARSFVLALGTFDYRDQREYAASLAPLTTGPLRDALTAASVDPKAARTRRTNTTRIESASVTSLADGLATVAVTSTQERRWVDPVLGQSLHESLAQLVLCQLVREDGRWLVAGLHPQAVETARPVAR